MRVKQIALAVTLTGAALSATAQTASTVTLYGRAYVMLESVRAAGSTVAPPSRNRVSDRNSLFGLRAREDLGGGLSAFFQIESLTAIDDPATNQLASRNSGVGLTGSWGSVVLGRWDTPFKIAHAAAADPFQDLSLADVTGVAMNQGNFSRRENNMVQYWSPKFGNTSFRLHYSANEGKTATVNPWVKGASVTYTDGKLYVAYAYERHNDQRAATVTAGIKETGNAVSANYKLGPVKLYGQTGRYQRTGTNTQRGDMIGAEWTIGAHNLLVALQKSRDGGAPGAVQPNCKLTGLGYRYEFSKRTWFVAEYAKVDNDSTATCNFGTAPLGISAGQDPRGFGMGVRHTF